MDLAISSERDFSTLASTSTTLAAEESAVSSERLTGQDEASPDFLTDQQMLGSGTPTTPSDGGMQVLLVAACFIDRVYIGSVYTLHCRIVAHLNLEELLLKVPGL